MKTLLELDGDVRVRRGGHPPHPHREGGPALQRRHRDLHQGRAEDDADVGDRANDRVRVDGSEVRARVLGEGGNLSITQRGRLEYWAHGRALNTDAVDNSGGVDTSDHEVNIKILMDLLIKKGVIKGREERNRILAEMTGRGGRAGAGRQREPGAGHHARRPAQRRALRGLRRPDRGHGGRGHPEPRGRRHPHARGAAGEPAPGARPAAAAAGRAARPHEDVGLGADAGDGLPGQRAGRPLLDAYFPKRLRESFGQHFGEHTCGARSSAPPPSTTW